MSTFWADACSNEENKSLQNRLNASYGSCGTTIAVYCVSAIASGIMFYRWFILGEERRKLVWRLYGWFSGLMLCGSCIGAVTWAAFMQVITNEFIGVRHPTISLSQRFFFWSLSDRWNSGHKVMYAIEFFLLSLAKLIVLDQLSNFASREMTSRHWILARHIVMSCVISGNLVGLAGNIAASVHYDRRADLLLQVSTDLAAGDPPADYTKFAEVADELELVLAISSVQMFCEVVVLLLIVLSFIVVGIACITRVSSGLSVLENSGTELATSMRLRQQVVALAMALARQMRKEVVATTGVVFVTFLIRSAYSTLYAVAFKLQNFSNIAQRCPGASVCDPLCFNVFTHIHFWLLRMPEFNLTIVLLSKPLPLLFVLWQMSTGSMWRDMHPNRIEMVKLKPDSLKKLAFWRISRERAIPS